MMTEISYSGYRFPPEIIQQAIWLYVRFSLSFRDVEDLLAEIMANAPTMQADRVYISSGSNDPDNPALSANLEHTRAKIGGVITWIEPVNARAASVVAAV